MTEHLPWTKAAVGIAVVAFLVVGVYPWDRPDRIQHNPLSERDSIATPQTPAGDVGPPQYIECASTDLATWFQSAEPQHSIPDDSISGGIRRLDSVGPSTSDEATAEMDQQIDEVCGSPVRRRAVITALLAGGAIACVVIIDLTRQSGLPVT